MIYLKKTYLIIAFFFIGINGIIAQLPQQSAQPAEITDAEMNNFATAFVEIQTIDEQLQQKMISAVQNEGLEVQRFNEILNAQQDPDQETDASEDELEKFASASQSVELIQNEGQEDMQKAITDNNLTVNRYQEIMTVMQSDPELQQRLQELIEEEE